eukprot:m.481980 g.481980  ORF g.481980 m.481980 type:complete len:212 (+) comp22397_c0_seq1:244-879(+)
MVVLRTVVVLVLATSFFPSQTTSAPLEEQAVGGGVGADPVICGNGTSFESVCPPAHSCCASTIAGEYGCCPHAPGVCCPDRKHCCAGSQHTVQCLTNNTCVDNTTGITFQASLKVHAVPVVPAASVTLPAAKLLEETDQLDGTLGCKYCDSDDTCCLQSSGDYMCCTYANANCCPDKWCCPASYTCKDGTCYPNPLQIFGIKTPQQTPAQK